MTMEEEKIKLLQLLFPDSKFDELCNKDFYNDYLKKLGNYKVDELAKEPYRLQEVCSNIQEQTQELAVTNYKTFIETAVCSRELFSQFNTIEEKLDKLLTDIPEFQNKCKKFNDTSSEISNLRKLNSLTLSKNAQLLEILELPQLMNSFIKDNLYDDALELAAYVRKIYAKYNDIPVFKCILNDVDHTWLIMLHQLLSQLKQELSLPKCIQIVGHLRRMEVFTELELKLKFLQARGYFLDQCLRYIPKDDSNHHLTKTVEITRVNLFNIITQYKAIFNDEESVPLSALRSDINENIIFYTWINDRITEFLSTLEQDLKGVSSVDSILDQCMYFGLSFSKVGCDFRSLLVPIFTKQIIENFQNSIQKTIVNFEKSIEHFTLINKYLPNIPWKNKDDDPLRPPDTLLEFYPLAEYLNNVLKILNEFRVCAPVAAVNEIIVSLQKSLLFIANSLLTLYSQEHQAFNSNSKDAFTRLCMSFSDDLIPYIQKCIHIIYPPNQISVKLGISLQTLQEEKISFLNKELLIEPIKHLLPPKIELDFNFEDINSKNSIVNNSNEEKVDKIDVD